MTTGSVKMTRYSPRFFFFFFFLSRFYGTKVYHNSTVRTTSYDQEVFLGQNQVSDLFCGDDGTKLNFFLYLLPDYCHVKIFTEAIASLKQDNFRNWSFLNLPNVTCKSGSLVIKMAWQFCFLSLPESKKMENAKWDQYFSAHFQYLWTE